MIYFKKVFQIIILIALILIAANGCRSVDCSKENVELPVGNLGTNVNSPFDDFGAVITDNGTMLFTSNKQGIEGYIDQYSKYGEDLFWSRDIGGRWTKADIFDNFEPTTAKNEGVPTIATEIKKCYFARSYDESGIGGSDIFSGNFNETTVKISDIKNVESVNSNFWDAQPAISADGKMMIFVSDRPGGYGGTDLYVSFNSNGKWTNPRNLGAKFNTPGNEYSPSFLCEKDTVLFFASDGRENGIGKLDIYYAYRNCNNGSALPEGWYEVVPAGGNINTPFNDAFPFPTRSSKQVYFASDRDGGCGGYDLYSEALKFKTPCLPLKGIITDKATGNIIKYPVSVSFKNRFSGEQINIDTQDGTYQFESFCRGDFTISITADRYNRSTYNYTISACETELIHELESECFAVKGVVIDSSKSAVLGREIKILVPATIEFKNKQSGDIISVKTNPPLSNYSIDKICPGDYEVTIKPQNEERTVEETYVGYWDKRYDLAIDFSKTNLVHEIVPWEYEFVNDSIPFFVTGYYVPNVPKSLSQVRDKRKAGNVLAKADYIRENEENADHYSVKVKEKFDTFINYLDKKIFPLFVKAASKNTFIEIKIEGYTDPRRIIPNYYYEENISHENKNVTSATEKTISVRKLDPMNNQTLSILRAYYTMQYLKDRMKELPLYTQLKNEGRIVFILDGKGVAPGASRDRPTDFPANRHVRIFVSQRRTN